LQIFSNNSEATTFSTSKMVESTGSKQTCCKPQKVIFQ